MSKRQRLAELRQRIGSLRERMAGDALVLSMMERRAKSLTAEVALEDVPESYRNNLIHLASGTNSEPRTPIVR